jgi:hypothetical protein
MNVRIEIDGQKAIKQTLTRMVTFSSSELASRSKVGVRNLMKDHFYTYGQRNPNKLKGQSTGYWQRAGDATTVTSSGASVMAEVVETRSGQVPLVGVRRHYTGGGTIRPSGRNSEVTGKPIKFLTIPKIAAAHGKSVATLKALGVDLYRKGATLREKQGDKRSDSDPIYFILAKQVGPMQPKPQILPTSDQFGQAVVDVALDMIDPEGNG